MPTTVEIVGETAHVCFHHPDVRNGLDERRCDELIAAIESSEVVPQVRFLVLHGAPGWFCIGGSGEYLERALQAELGPRAEFTRRVQRVIMRLLKCELLTVAVVDGLAAAAGVDLLFASDLVLATPSARVSLLYSKLGLVPDVGLALIERRLVGVDALLLYAESPVLDATRLGAMGLAEPAPADIGAAALSVFLARRFRHQRAAFAMTKRLRNLSLERRLAEETAVAAIAQAEAFEHPATRERVLRSAGLQKAT